MYYKQMESHYFKTKRFCQKTKFSILMAISKEVAVKVLVNISEL